MRWFPFINLTLSALLIFTLFLCFFVMLPKKEEWTVPQGVDTLKTLPKSPFEYTSLEDFHTGPFAIKWSEPKMQLPCLSGELLYYGLVQRPDIPENKKLVHLSLSGQEEIQAFDVSEPVYLLYNGNGQQSAKSERIFTQAGERAARFGYSFSPENLPTTLWLDLFLEPNCSLKVEVNMLDEQGELIVNPKESHFLSLSAQDIPRLKQVGWEIDSSRVDSTLLIRQKARWVGRDLFLQEHGGEEFASAKDKERIDFGAETPYSCFVQEGSFLIWEDGRWVDAAGRSTWGLPLLVTKKIEERLLSFELWDPQGKGKTLLTLVRSKDLSGLPNLEEEFKFIGAKTWAKFIVESHQERLILKPHDWLVLTENGWIQLNTDELVDDYVEQRLQGPLLILDKLTKQNGKQVLTGKLFNTTRTQAEPIELSTTSNATLANSFNLPSSPSVRFSNQFDFEDDIE